MCVVCSVCGNVPSAHTGAGMAVGAVVGGDSLVHLFGEWVFLALSAGAAVSAFMALLPPWYQRLDPDAELVKLLNSETPPQP